MNLYRISYFIVIFLSLIGLLFLYIAIHEGKHFIDLKDDSEIIEVCLLSVYPEFKDILKTNGYVLYSGEGESSEFSAYFISLLISMIFTSFAMYYFIENYWRDWKIDNYIKNTHLK